MPESDSAYDALLIVSFGGPEGPDDVLPFLERVTRGKNVPRERLEIVAAHYHAVGGKSPINEQARAFVDALGAELRANDIDLPIYLGNRNSPPYLEDALRQMRQDGRTRALAFVMSTFSSYSGCRQYLENIEEARTVLGEGAPEVHKLRSHFNHPGFIEAMSDRVEEALSKLPSHLRKGARIAFTAHSIPVEMAESSSYVAQLEEASTLVAERVQHKEWQLVYQSRSGSPRVPWLEPDIIDHLEALAAIGTEAVVVVPIGFLSDHMEVVWDLDREAKLKAVALELEMVRAKTVGTHPAFVAAICELITERLGGAPSRRVLGTLGAALDTCAPGC
ncbi:MAG: ferrochelatase, partial [Polyangiaceae bacterium]|nr:ferrochelatase [Polyangiaceae bacterium]